MPFNRTESLPKPRTFGIIEQIVAAVDAQRKSVSVTTNLFNATVPFNLLVSPGVGLTSLNIELPAITSELVSDGVTYMVKDVAGSAATKPITINPFAGDTIDGGATLTINTNNNSVSLMALTLTRWGVVK